MKITTLVPLQFNDRRPVPEEQLRQIIDGLVKQFGACTEEGKVVGHRPEPDRPGIAHENFLKLSIEMDRQRLDEARIGQVRRTGQEQDFPGRHQDRA